MNSGPLDQHPRTLMLTATFPPRGGSGVQRVWYQALAMNAAGFDLHVVTENESATWVADKKSGDTALAAAVSRVNSSPSKILRLLSRIASRLAGTTMYPDSHWQWILSAYRRCCKVIISEEKQVLLVSFGHPSALIVAALTKRRFSGLKLVIDVRDLWVGNPNQFSYVRRSGLMASLDRRIERWAFAKADRVIGVSTGVVEEHRYQWLRPDQTHVVQNGFDAAMFDASESSSETSRTNSGVVFRHVGFVGPTQRLDVFFRAVFQLKANDDIGLSDVRFEFTGGNPEYVRSLAASIGVDDLVYCTEYVEHQEAVELMCSADVLLLFWGLGKGTVGGKTYEYLRTNRFIMALDQENQDGRALLEETGRGVWVAADDMSGQVEMLNSLVFKLRNKVVLLEEPLVSVSKYSRESQNAYLIEVLDAAIRESE